MESGKSKEEFEAAYIAGLVRRCGEGFRSTVEYSLTEKNPDGRYKNYSDFIAWWAWQASRQSLVIELPSHLDHTSVKHAIEACAEAIESVGIGCATSNDPKAQYTAVDRSTAAADGYRDAKSQFVVTLPAPHTDYSYSDSEVAGAVKFYEQAVKAIKAAGGSVKE